MKRILFVSNIPTPYQIDFFNKVSGLADIKCIFLSRSESNRDWSLDLPCWAKICPPENSWLDVKKEIKKFRPTSIVVGGYSLRFSLRLLYFSKTNKIFFAYWLERPLPSASIKTVFKKLWLLTFVARANKIFAIGSGAQSIYSRYNERSVNLPYSIDLSRYSPKRGKKNKVRFIFLGQYITRKGVLPLVEAIQTLPQTGFAFHFVGSGALRDKIQSICERHVCVNELDFVEPESLPELLSNYDVLVAPSLHDGWAVVIPEALASGLSVISTPYAGAAVDLICSKGSLKNGMVIEPTKEALKAEILKYIDGTYDLERESRNAIISVSKSLAITDNAAPLFLEHLR